VALSIPQITPSGFPPRRLHALFPFGDSLSDLVHLVSILGLRPHSFLAQAIVSFICQSLRLARFKTPVLPVIRIPVVFRKPAVSMAFALFRFAFPLQGAGIPAPIQREILALNSSDEQPKD
jgi:hypothetical protein